MRYRNAIALTATTIDAEIEHPAYGWISIALNQNDPPTAAWFEAVSDRLPAMSGELEDPQ